MGRVTLRGGPILARRHNDSAGERHIAHHEPQHGRRRLRIDVNMRHRQRMDHKPVVVHTGALGRSRPDELLRTGLVRKRDRSLGKHGRIGHPCPSREARHVRGNICDRPVPEAGTGRRIRVVAGNRETLGALGESGPGQLRRTILPSRVHSVLFRGQRFSVLDVGTRERKFWNRSHERERID